MCLHTHNHIPHLLLFALKVKSDNKIPINERLCLGINLKRPGSECLPTRLQSHKSFLSLALLLDGTLMHHTETPSTLITCIFWSSFFFLWIFICYFHEKMGLDKKKLQVKKKTKIYTCIQNHQQLVPFIRVQIWHWPSKKRTDIQIQFKPKDTLLIPLLTRYLL